jgi:hypothetical protein
LERIKGRPALFVERDYFAVEDRFVRHRLQGLGHPGITEGKIVIVSGAEMYWGGIAEDTIVIFTSDHGDMMLSQGLTTKLYPWDESVRIPLLIRYPRKLGRRGSRVNTAFGMPDLMPTVLTLAGLPIPDSVEGSDRRNTVPKRVSAVFDFCP